MRYVHLPATSVDTQLLEDATRRGKFPHLTSFWRMLIRQTEAAQASAKAKQG